MPPATGSRQGLAEEFPARLFLVVHGLVARSWPVPSRRGTPPLRYRANGPQRTPAFLKKRVRLDTRVSQELADTLEARVDLAARARMPRSNTHPCRLQRHPIIEVARDRPTRNAHTDHFAIEGEANTELVAHGRLVMSMILFDKLVRCCER